MFKPTITIKFFSKKQKEVCHNCSRDLRRHKTFILSFECDGKSYSYNFCSRRCTEIWKPDFYPLNLQKAIEAHVKPNDSFSVSWIKWVQGYEWKLVINDTTEIYELDKMVA